MDTVTVPEIQVDPPEPSTSTNQQKGPTEGAEAGEARDTETDESKEFPFQLQIRYTDTEGAKALRVITQTKPITRDRKKAEQCKSLYVLTLSRKAVSFTFVFCKSNILTTKFNTIINKGIGKQFL